VQAVAAANPPVCVRRTGRRLLQTPS
jgi:hypothetical protein